jgi:protocatechuate 3,4-dioxygenase beta subunit
MVRGHNGRLASLIGALLFALVALPAAAQSTGIVKGAVKDAAGKPVEGAKISIDMSEGMNRHFQTTSDKKGEFVQIGLPPGRYTVTAEKDKQGSAPAMAAVTVGRPAEVNLVIGAGGAAGGKELAAKNAELRKAFEEGIAASNANNYDAAIAAFAHAAEINPSCSDCQYSMGLMCAEGLRQG